MTWPQQKVLDATSRCRTAALGGHRDVCLNCGHQAISYNSCRNRHCPKCQTAARDPLASKRQQELLLATFIVFSVPHELVPLIWQNKRQLFPLLFEASACAARGLCRSDTLAHTGFLSILHTWGQTLTPIRISTAWQWRTRDRPLALDRVACQIPAAVKVLSRVFRGKFMSPDYDVCLPAISCASSVMRATSQPEALRHLPHARSIAKTGSSMPSRPSAARMCCIIWLATPIVAISNHRLLSVSAAEVCFRWKDYAHHGRQRT